MPDISLCFGEGCPLKENCYRFKAPPDDYLQSYFTIPPFKEGSCEFFWPIEERKLKYSKQRNNIRVEDEDNIQS